MRLQHPDDELGGMLMLNLPNIVVHALDNWSPLVPHPMDLCLWRAPSSSPRVSPASDDSDDDDDHNDWCTDEGGNSGDVSGFFGRGNPRKQRHDPMSQCRFPDVLQRASDCENGSRDSVMCSTCGETFPHERALRKHMRYNCTGDEISGWEMSLMCSVCGEAFVSRTALQLHKKASVNCVEAGTAAAAAVEAESDDDANVLARAQESRDDESARYRRTRHRDVRRPGQDRVAAAAPGPLVSNQQSDSIADVEQEPCRSRELIEKWLKATQAEIIVLVEGIDATTSYTVQARHSYTWQELAWDCTFAQTVFPSERPPISDPGTGTGAGGGQIAQQGCMIDFTKFNDLVPVRSDGKRSPREFNPLPSQQQQRYGEIIQ
jgi:ribosomal protein S26